MVTYRRRNIDVWRGDTWTRTLEPFGITVHCRNVTTKVAALRFHTGSLVHEVDGAILEWVIGAPKMHMRYLLVCGSQQDQRRAQPMLQPTVITCGKCRERKR